MAEGHGNSQPDLASTTRAKYRQTLTVHSQAEPPPRGPACPRVVRAAWSSTTKMVDFADSTAFALDVELLGPAAAGRCPRGEQLLEANLYAVCDRVGGRAARASSARPSR